MKTRTRRRSGYIVHVGQSRSAGFWAVIKSRDDGRLHFAYGKSFLSSGIPKIGHEVEFTRLPPADRGDMDRAIEITIVRQSFARVARLRLATMMDSRKLIGGSAGSGRVIGEAQL